MLNDVAATIDDVFFIVDEIHRAIQRAEPPTQLVDRLEWHVTTLERLARDRNFDANQHRAELVKLRDRVVSATAAAENWLHETQPSLERDSVTERHRRTYRHTYDDLR